MKSSLVQFWDHFKSRHREIEKQVSMEEGFYAGLNFEALYTSLDDLEEIFRSGKIGGTFADLGCGTGFSSLMYGSMFPDRKAYGIEFVKERLILGKEFQNDQGLFNVSLLQGNLLNCEIPQADTYFLYFPTGPVLDRILSELYFSQHGFKLLIIESHGDLIHRIELENWLTLQEEIPLKSSRHFPFARIYQRTSGRRAENLIPFEHSYRNHFLLIEDGFESWIGSTMGMEWTKEDRFELKNPPRTIFWKDVKKLMLNTEEYDPRLRTLLELWNGGEVEITIPAKVLRGLVRKIIVAPSFKVEISSGEKVEWSQILKITQGSKICYAVSSSS